MENADQMALHAEDSLKKMDDLLIGAKPERVLEMGKDLLASLADDPASADSLRWKCLVKIGDALFALKQFDQSLETYEQALSMSRGQIDDLSVEALAILFKIERTLNTLCMMDSLSEAETELKSALVSQYLQAADDADSAVSGYRDSQIEAQLLDDLWASAIERQKLDEVNTKSSWSAKIEKLLENKLIHAIVVRLETLSAGFVVVGLSIAMIHFFLTHHIEETHDETLATSYAVTATAPNRSISLQSFDRSQTLVLKQNNKATLVSNKGTLQGSFIFYDGSPLSALRTIFYSYIGPSMLLNCAGCSVASQSGAVFFISQANDFKLVEVMNEVAGNARTYLRQNQRQYESLANSLAYTNPFTKRVQSVRLAKSLSTELQTEANRSVPGTIVLLPNANNDFQLLGYFHRGIPFTAFRTADGWQPMYPNENASQAPMRGSALFIFCERPLDPITLYLKSNLYTVLSIAFVAVLLLPFAIKIAD